MESRPRNTYMTWAFPSPQSGAREGGQGVCLSQAPPVVPIYTKQCFSNSRGISHRLYKAQVLLSPGLQWGPGVHILTSSQVMSLPPLHGPHSEQQGTTG